MNEAVKELSGTDPLTMGGDIPSRLVDGADVFLLRKLEQSISRRADHWSRDVSSPEAYVRSVKPNRDRLAHILGVRDERVPFTNLELVGTTEQSSLIGRGQGYEVHVVRWPAVGDVNGEGLMLTPDRKPIANVIAIPDADLTPEQVVGLVNGVPPASQYARRLVEAGCRVVVPTLIARDEASVRPLGTLILSLLHMFDSEATASTIIRTEDIEEIRHAWAVDLLKHALGSE